MIRSPVHSTLPSELPALHPRLALSLSKGSQLALSTVERACPERALSPSTMVRQAHHKLGAGLAEGLALSPSAKLGTGSAEGLSANH